MIFASLPPIASEPGPVLAVCSACLLPVRHNEILGISFCQIHGLSKSFRFAPPTQYRPRGI
jgi:hypothetical protein